MEFDLNFLPNYRLNSLFFLTFKCLYLSHLMSFKAGIWIISLLPPNLLLDETILELWWPSWIMSKVHISAIGRATSLKFRIQVNYPQIYYWPPNLVPATSLFLLFHLVFLSTDPHTHAHTYLPTCFQYKISYYKHII